MVHAVFGDDIPFLLIGWMPYRIPNHLAPILLCMLLKIMARGTGESRRYKQELWAARISILAFPVAASGAMLPDWFFDRYLAGGEYLLFFLLGGALGVLLDQVYHDFHSRFPRAVLTAIILGLVLAWFNQFVFLCTYAGFGFHILVRLLNRDREPRFNWVRISGVCIAIVLSVHLVRQWVHREHLPRTAFQQGVVDYLADANESTATIVAPLWEVQWSARVGVPVFADYQTPRLVTYIPALGPSLKKMHRDVFGFNIDGESNDGLSPAQAHSREQWQQLGEDYGFRYVVQPKAVALDLDPVYEADDLVLYAVPK